VLDHTMVVRSFTVKERLSAGGQRISCFPGLRNGNNG
jgi:hypothetical protein